jgi:hypothetical protein
MMKMRNDLSVLAFGRWTLIVVQPTKLKLLCFLASLYLFVSLKFKTKRMYNVSFYS